MFPFGSKIKTSDVEEQIRKAVEDVVRHALADSQNALTLSRDLVKLRQELETLKIEKARVVEGQERSQREIDHKIGLERNRQKFEREQTKREATVSVREENLKADRDRFEAQLKFHEDRFSEEVKYLKELMVKVMERLPDVNHKITEKRNG